MHSILPWAAAIAVVGFTMPAAQASCDLDEDGFDAVRCGGDDCNDDDPAYHPGAEDVPCDGLDHNCNYDDEWPDEDGDGYPWCYDIDCDDSDPAVGAKWNDHDGDGWGESVAPCDVTYPTATQGPDCAWDDPTIHPGAEEACDGVDNNCDGAVDESCVEALYTYYRDDDGDGFGGLSGYSTNDSTPPDGYVTEAGDCNDDDPAYHPGAEDVPCDGLDHNCNYDDEWPDEDGDGYPWCYNIDCDDSDPSVGAKWNDHDGDGWGESVAPCDVTYATATQGPDCAWDDPTIYPGAEEVCDGVDNNCDGAVDEACECLIADDDFEPNDDASSAAWLSYGGHPGLQLCVGEDAYVDGNVDWFVLEDQALGSYRYLRVDTDPSVDVSLYLYDSALTEVGYADTAGTGFSGTVLTTDAAYLEVIRWVSTSAPCDCAEYTLQLDDQILW